MLHSLISKVLLIQAIEVYKSQNDIPLHCNPFPTNPAKQWHSNFPLVDPIQVALILQLLSSVSQTSITTKKDQ